ncbi:MAG: hypothetical protein ACXW61_03735 [Gemmatirosa sp.]
MTLTPHARRLALLGTVLTLTLASAGWLFFGTRAEDAPVVVATSATAAPVTPSAAKRDSAAPIDSAAPAEEVRAVARRDTTPAMATIEREVFAYAGSGRRDPFRALIATSVIRPMPNELRLVAVVYDPRGAGSVAILRDSTTHKQHRVRTGQLLGRMRVAQIRPKHVVFTIEELGFSRQEILGLKDSTATRLP